MPTLVCQVISQVPFKVLQRRHYDLMKSGWFFLFKALYRSMHEEFLGGTHTVIIKAPFFPPKTN